MSTLDLGSIRTSIIISETPEKLEYWRGYLTALKHMGQISIEDYEKCYKLIEEELKYSFNDE
jgi:hypothetical protein